MDFKFDHDLHIHSRLSLCSNDPEQTKENILKYAIDNKLKYICLADHFWDDDIPCPSDWYRAQNLEHIKEALPLPDAAGIQFKFGCETEMDKHFNICITDEVISKLDFVIVPINHLHMTGLTLEGCDLSAERLAVLYVHRFNALLNKKFPENKVGIAHLTCPLLAGQGKAELVKILDMIPDSVFRDLFSGAEEKKIGIELNLSVTKYSPEELSSIMRPYFIAKEVGCKFYLGSDSHHPADFIKAKSELSTVLDILKLTENDKFIPSCFR